MPKMTPKRNLATRIAVALHPQEFCVNSPAIQGEVERLMKFTVKELEANLHNLESVELIRRQNELAEG